MVLRSRMRAISRFGGVPHLAGLDVERITGEVPEVPAPILRRRPRRLRLAWDDDTRGGRAKVAPFQNRTSAPAPNGVTNGTNDALALGGAAGFCVTSA